MRCSRHAWTGPAAERQAAGDGATAPAPAGCTCGPRRRRSIFRSSACSFLFLIGSRPCISPPHPALCLQPTPMRADGSIRARWHILMWIRPGPHLHMCPRPHSACRARASCWTDPMTPHSLPTRPGLHLRAPRPHSRHTKQVAFFIWHSPPNHLPQNALWILLRGVL